MDGFEKWRHKRFIRGTHTYAETDLREAWQESAKIHTEQERKRIVAMLKEWRRHHGIMSDPKSMHYTMCIEEILNDLADRIEDVPETDFGNIR
jgi:hypothetical protein